MALSKHILIAFSVSALLVGCGGGGSGDGDSNLNPSPNPSPDNVSMLPDQGVQGQAINNSQATVPLESACAGNATDGFQSTHFEVFAQEDRSASDVLRYYAAESEQALAQLQSRMVFTDAEMRLNEANRERFPLCLVHIENAPSEGTNGRITLPLVGELRARFAEDGESGLLSQFQLLQHELVHTLQERLTNGFFRIEREDGTVFEGNSAPAWYSEGIATFFARQEIARNTVAARQAREGDDRNPVEIFFFSGPSDGSQVNLALYAVYAATVEIMTNDPGIGFGQSDEALVLEVYRDMVSSGRTFQESFIQIFGDKLENEIPGAGFSDYDSFANNYDAMVDAVQDRHEVTVTATNPDDTDATFITDNGLDFDGSRFLEMRLRDGNGDIKVMPWHIDASEEYDAYFAKIVSETDEETVVDFYGPIPAYVNNAGDDLSLEAPGSDAQVNLSNYPRTRITSSNN